MKYAIVIGNEEGYLTNPAVVLAVSTSADGLTAFKDALNFALSGNDQGSVPVVHPADQQPTIAPWLDSNAGVAQGVIVRVEETVIVGDFLSPSPDVFHKYVAA